MKNFFILLLLVGFGVSGQTKYYIIAKSGLNLREKSSTSATLLATIPYGAVIEEFVWTEVPIELDNIAGFWVKTKYAGNVGYVASQYISNFPAPRIGTKDMYGYFNQLSEKFGTELVIDRTPKDSDNMWRLSKQLYKNGNETHYFGGYEFGSSTYFLMDCSIETAYLLLKLIPEFETLTKRFPNIPKNGGIFKKEQEDISVKITKENGNIASISLSYSEGSMYEFKMYYLENQVVIYFSNGV